MALEDDKAVRLGIKSSLQTAQTMAIVLQLRNMGTGIESEAFKAAEAALIKNAGNALQGATANTGNGEMDDLINMSSQSSHSMEIVRERWGVQGVNYISNLIKAGRGDLAAAIVYAISAIIAETSMRTFGLNDEAIAALEKALAADMKSPIVAWNAKHIAKRQAVEARKAELIAGGALGDQSALEQKVNDAQKGLDQSKDGLSQAVQTEKAERNTFAQAQASFAQNYADANAMNAASDALDSLLNAKVAREKAEQALKDS